MTPAVVEYSSFTANEFCGSTNWLNSAIKNIAILGFKKEIAKPFKYAWEDQNYNDADDPFLQQFDADGNFIETLEETHTADPSVEIQYNYKEKDV